MLCERFFSLGFALLLLAAVLLPIARALLLVIWVYQLSCLPPEAKGPSVAVSWFISSLILVIFVGWADSQWVHIAGLGFAGATSIAMTCFLLKEKRLNVVDSSSATIFKGSGCQVLPQELIIIIVFAGLLNFFATLIHSLTSPHLGIVGIDSRIAQPLCKLAAAIVTIVAWRKLTNVDALTKTFQALYLIVLFSGLLLFFSEPFGHFFLSGLTGTTTAFASIIFVIISLEEAERLRVDIMVVFSVFAGIYYICMSLGNLAGSAAYTQASSGYIYAVVAIGVVYLLSVLFFAYSLFFTQKLEQRLAAHQAVIAENSTDRIAGHCVELACEFNLSPREKEVLEVIAYGRDAAYASSKLFVSESTIRSHIKSIYRKLDIHSRQELFALVNGDVSEDISFPRK